MKKFLVKVIMPMALISVFALSACNSDNNNNDTVTPPPAQVEETVTPVAPTEAPATPGTEVVEATEPTEVFEPSAFTLHDPVDLGGRTIQIGAFWESVVPFSAHNWDEPDPATADNYFVARMIWENSLNVLENFNVNLEETILSYDEMLPALTASVMAGDPFSDLMYMSGSWMLPAIQGDLILPFAEINFPGSDLLSGTNHYTRVVVEGLGGQWSFMDGRIDTSGTAMGINLDIINQIGAPNPVDLYNSGTWTWDAMLDIMRLATADTTGDGMNDRFGISGQPGDIAFYLIGGNDGRMVSDDFNYYLDHPNTIEALEFLETIFVEGLWEYDRGQGMDVGDWGRNFWSFQNGTSALFPTATWALSNDPLSFEFAVVPWPTGPANTSGNTWMGGWGSGFAFPHGSDWDPGEILMVIESFFAWPGDELDLLEEYAMGWPRTIFLTDEDILRQASVTDTMAQDLGMVVPQYNWIFGTFVDHFASGTMTVQQVVETYRGPQQELLDSFFGEN